MINYDEYKKTACPSCGRKNGSGHSSLCLVGEVSEYRIRCLFVEGQLDLVRVQRKRTRGWRMPRNVVYVGRPGKWGNHHNWKESFGGLSSAADHEKRKLALDRYINWFVGLSPEDLDKLGLHELRGKSLACFCPIGSPCHGDFLLEMANK